MYREINEEGFQTELRNYLSHDLDEAARAGLRERLSIDADARAELAFSRRLRLATSEGDLMAVAAIARQVTGNPPPAGPAKLPWWKGGFGIALVIIGLIISAFSLYTLVRAPTPAQVAQDLSEELIRPLEALLITEDSGQEELSRAMAAYRAADYPRAAELLGAYSFTAQDPNAGLYAGISYLLAGEVDLAVIYLRQSRENAEFPVDATARYYEMLALLRSGQVEAVREALATSGPENLYEAEYARIREVLSE